MPTSSKAKTDEVVLEESDVSDANDMVVVSEQRVTLKTLKKLHGTPTIPKRWKTLSDCVAGVMYGAELGLAPLESLQRMYMVNGGIACDSKGLNSLIHRAGHYLMVEEMSAERAAVKAVRHLPNGEYVEVGVFDFTMEDAERAGLAGQDTYQDYPRDLLMSKAVSRAAKVAFPDVTTGMLTPEELGGETDATGMALAADIPDEVVAEALTVAALDAEVIEEIPYSN